MTGEHFIWDPPEPAEGATGVESVPVHGLSKRELAKALGKPLKTIDKLCRDGLPSRSAGSRAAGLRFDLPQVIEWYAAQRAAEAGGDAGDALAAVKLRKAAAEAEKLEHANRKAAGELVDSATVARDIADGVAGLRSALLAIPARLTDQPEPVKAAVRSEIVAAINTLANNIGGGDAV